MHARIPGRAPVGVTDGERAYLILCDQLGTPVALANLEGDIVQSMRYDSFGNPLRGLQGPVRLPLGFAGGLHDADTGLTRFVWRDYDADTGRFTGPDPMASGPDAYASRRMARKRKAPGGRRSRRGLVLAEAF